MEIIMNNSIPFLDLVTPHEDLKEELCSVFRRTLATAGFIGGPMVAEFECDFARFCDTEYCIGVGSGTDALRFALIAAGVKEGDIVCTVPNTFGIVRPSSTVGIWKSLLPAGCTLGSRGRRT